MKKIFIYFILITILIFPVGVNAAGNISISASSVSLTTGQSRSITISANGAAGQVSISSSNASIASVSNNSVWIDPSSSFTIYAKSAGTTTIHVSCTDVSDTSYNNVSCNYSITVSVSSPTPSPSTPSSTPSNNYTQPSSSSSSNTSSNVNLSSNNNLNNLSVSGCSLSPSFNANTTSYTCQEVDLETVNVSASKSDGSASVSGVGTRTLNFGENSLSVVVTAANGNKKTYTIKVNRKDTRNTDNTLSSLTVKGQNIKFKKDKISYSLKVSSKIEFLEIEAVPTDSKAIVSGIGKINVQTGDNKIEIIVTAENGSTKIYTINCNKSKKANIPSTTLSLLKYGNTELDLSTNEKIFLIGLNSKFTSLDLKYETSSSTTKYKIIGNNKLKEGINKITISLSDNKCKNSKYTIYVYVPSKKLTKINSLNGIEKIKNNLIYSNSKNSDQLIPSEFIKLIKKSKYSLTYNIVNSNGGLLYSFSLNKNLNVDELKFIKSSDSPLSYVSNIPNGIKVTAYIDNLYKDNTSLFLYTYDLKHNSYKLINKNIKVTKGYINFISNGSDQYILSNKKIHSNLYKWLIRFMFAVIGAVIEAIIYIIYKRYFTNHDDFTPIDLNNSEVEEILDEEEKTKETIEENNKEIGI